MSISDNFLKSYSDRNYKNSTMVRHKGTVVALAMDDRRRIYYSVLDLNNSEKGKSPLDVHYWLENPKQLNFCNEVVQVGYGIVDPTKMPIVKKGSRAEAEPGTLRPEEIDPFLSTTARFTADTPFQALSDGKYIYIFRQSIDSQHEDMVYARNSDGSPILDQDGNKVPVIEETLLVDRFVLVGSELVPKREVRYKRSRNKYRFDSNKDSLGAQDMEKKPFLEPTQELDFVRNLRDGRFTVLLLPTQIAEIQRWQIFTHNSQTGLIDSFNIERYGDGLFNTKGTQFYTSPSEEYQKSVFERQPGTCPFTGQDLIPIFNKSGYAESALDFDGHTQINCGQNIDLANKSFTVEFWVKRGVIDGKQQLLVSQAQQSNPKLNYGFLSGFRSNNKFFMAFWGNPINTNEVYTDQNWHHWTCTYNHSNKQQTLYCDGILLKTRIADSDCLASGEFRLGCSFANHQKFQGQIDEVRLWNRPRSQDEIQGSMNYRLVGNEPGLIGYWRFDEAAGNTVHDQTDNANHGTIEGSPQWVISEARIGEGFGIRRSSFKLNGRTIESGLSAILYYQQEEAATGYDQKAKPVKRNARVMLAVGTGEEQSNGGQNYIGVLDFGVSREGKLTQVPDNINLPLLLTQGLQNLSASELLDGISNTEESILRLKGDIKQLEFDIQNKNAEISEINKELAGLPGQTSNFQEELKQSQGHTYNVRVLTGDLSSADTDDRVYVSFKGTIRNSREERLNNPGGDFYKGRWDEYDISDFGNIGTIKEITVRKPSSDGWYLEKVEIEVYYGSKKLETLTFIHNGWLDSNSHGNITSVPLKPRSKSRLADSNQVQKKIDLTNERNQLSRLISGQNRNKADKQKQLSEAEKELIELKSQQGNVEPLPMSLLHIDPFGLTLSGAILSFADSKDAPQLFDSATGQIALYFQGRAGELDNQFFAAYYDTNTEKAQSLLPAETGNITFIARSTEPEIDEASITVSDGTTPDTCTVVIQNTTTDLTETWNDVPREVEQFINVLNGTANEKVFIGSLATDVLGTVTTLTLEQPVKYPLQPDDVLLIGETKLQLEGAVERNATSIEIVSSQLEFFAKTSVYLVAYDYAVKASTNKLTHNLQQGSLQFNAVPGNVNGKVQNGTATKSGTRKSCQWVPKSPGKALAFDGKDDYVGLAVPSDNLDADGDLTLEAWVNPNSMTGITRIIHHKSSNSQYTLGLKPHQDGYTCFMGVGNLFKQSQDLIKLQQWEHLAVAYQQSYGLQFNGSAYLNCPHNSTLNITQDLTIEVFLQVDDLRQRRGILSKGILDDGTKESVPYSLYLETNGKIAFAFEDKDGGNHIYYSSRTLRPGQFYKIAVTRSFKIETKEDRNGKYTATKWTHVRFYINQEENGYETRKGKDPGSCEQPLEIGKTYKGSQENYFKGIISEIRLYNKELSQENLGGKIPGDEDGLIAWWRFEENEYNIAHDSQSNNHAILQGAKWVKNPDINGSSLLFYHNGSPVKLEDMSQASWGSAQFTLGANQNGSLQECFNGIMEEARIWKVSRTQEQIQDNLFARLKGEKQDLIAYYTFDLESETELRDHSLLGNHLTVGGGDSQPIVVISTAPISDDIAQVRSALGGVKTQFHDTIHSRPGVQEYGDLQYDADGNLTGVHKRCYSYIKDNQWHLFTGYKVGNLVTEWIGQVQANPEIIGYIEGAPPVPSENLTGTSMKVGEFQDYSGCSAIELEEPESVNYIYAASKETGFDMSIDTTVGMGFAYKAEAGFGYIQEVANVTSTVGIKTTFEYSSSHLNESSVSYGRNTTKTSRLELRGAWEQAGSEINSAVGRRFIPANTGFALVQSDTMDVFALRLAHNNALVAYRIMPNPDIPKDWNIITFPLNKTYTKQGTLDGKVGLKEDGSVQCDPDYANATTYGQYSYFKPIEAYALKKQIEREQQQQETDYQNYSTSTSISGSSDDVPKKMAVHNLVNTYVWTADGGFFAESTEVMESVQESSTSSYFFQGMGGVALDLNLQVGFALKIEMDALFGGHVETIKTKGKETEKSFSIAVEAEPESDIQLYVNTDAEREKYAGRTNEGGGAYDEQGNPISRPGKVDAYRFLSFYLEPTKNNFEDFFNKVVDPIWLEQSDAPNAAALRQANQGDKKPKCWRIMHRVTFVSRILPEIEATNAPPMEKALRAAHIESNYELIKKLEPFVKNQTQDASSFADAVRKTLKTYLPELQPHEQDIIKYTALYFGVEEEL
ncbi:MAG: hypothetical protein F6K21_16330 [Symploca sp. SIO2D2]|nr:hypothetical protein [Symploca sp. SIO2D2]